MAYIAHYVLNKAVKIEVLKAFARMTSSGSPFVYIRNKIYTHILIAHFAAWNY